MLVNGVATGIQGLNTATSAYGDSLLLGSVNAGDILTFVLINLEPGDVGPWYSDTSLNSDGINHVYSYNYAGDSVLPAGTYVAFEDLVGGGDLNYNDETFIFTNVAVHQVPEPAAFLLMGLGLIAAGASRRVRR